MIPSMIFSDLGDAADRFYSDGGDAIDSLRIRFGADVNADDDFDLTDADVVVKSPAEAEAVQVGISN